MKLTVISDFALWSFGAWLAEQIVSAQGEIPLGESRFIEDELGRHWSLHHHKKGLTITLLDQGATH